MSSGLVVDGVSKRYGANSVLDDVSIEAPEGRVTGLLGPNGAGKTTLFRILMGLVRPDTGHVHLGKLDLLGLPLHEKSRAGLGYLPQDSASFPELTVRQNLLAVLELHVPNRRIRLVRADTLLADTGLDGIAHRRCAALSGGEARRLEVAKILVLEPRVLLLDEPFSGLDPRITEELVTVIRGMADRGLGVLITDHNVHSALRVTQYAFVLTEGRVAYEGTPEDLAASVEVRHDYLGSSFGPRL